MTTQEYAASGWRSARDRSHGTEVSPSSVLTAALVGIAFALAVILVDAPSPTGTGAFVDTGEYKLWVFVIIAQAALWAALVRPLLACARRLWDVWSGDSAGGILRTTVLFAVLVEGFVVVTAVRSGVDYPLPHHRTRILIMSEFGCAVALLGGACIALTDAKLEQLRTRVRMRVRVESRDLAAYLELRDWLRRLVCVEAAIIGVAILSSGALRNAVLAYDAPNHTLASLARVSILAPDAHAGFLAYRASSRFPAQYVLVYGAYFTLLLALLTVPVYGRLQAVGRSICHVAFPLGAPRAAEWGDGYENRKRCEELLGLRTGGSGGLVAGVAVLTPARGQLPDSPASFRVTLVPGGVRAGGEGRQRRIRALCDLVTSSGSLTISRRSCVRDHKARVRAASRRLAARARARPRS